MPDYSRDYIRKEVDKGKDVERARNADALAARAQRGDQAALAELQALSGVSDPSRGWATPDAKNYGRMLLQDLGHQVGYVEDTNENVVGKTLGGALKTIAPIGAAFIPGIGPIAAGLIGAAGSAAGGALAGDDFNLGKTLLAGAGSAGGNLLLGGQSFGGIKGIPGRLGLGGAGGVPGVGGGAGGAAGAVGDVAGAAGKGGGLFGTGIDLGDVKKYAPLVLGGLGTIQAGKQSSQAGNLRNQAVDMALADYQSRAPMRTAAMQRALAPMPTAPDLSAQFADQSNPFYRPLRAA